MGFVFLILLVLTPSVLSLGLSPGKRLLDYSPGLSKEVEVTIVNNEGKQFIADIEARGELADYVTLSTKSISFEKSDHKKTFTYRITLPDGINKPGVHNGKIVIRERQEIQEVIQPGFMLYSQIYVEVPYPGKYAIGEMIIKNAKAGSEVPIYIRVTNKGKESIASSKALVDIIDTTSGKIVDRIESKVIKLESQQVKELILKFDSADVAPGTYTSKATVHYDNNQFDISQNFAIEEFLVQLMSISVPSFELGEVANFDILLRNIGNRPIEDIYVNLYLKDEYGRAITDSQSFKVDMDREDTKVTNIYWDTTGLAAGVYTGLLTLHYENERLEKPITMQVKPNSIDISLSEATGFVIDDGAGNDVSNSLTLIYLLVGLVILLIIVIGAQFLLRNKKKK